MAEKHEGANEPTLLTIIRFGVLSFPVALLALPLYLYIPTLYIQEIGLVAGTVGAVLFATRIFDGITDPLIGRLSDRTQTKYGRRRPWLAAAVPITMVATWFLFLPPDNASVIYLFLWSFVFTIAWTMLTLPMLAWTAELTGDYHNRTRVTAVRNIYALLGTLVVTALPAILTLYGYGDFRFHLKVLAILTIIALPLAALLVLTTVKERPSLSRTETPGLAALFTPFQNSDFRRLMLAFFVNATANGLPLTLFIPFVTHRMGMGDVYGPLLFAYFVAGLIGIPFWSWIAKKSSKHRGWSIAMLWTCLAFAPTPFIVGEGDFTIFMVITILSGLGVGVDLAIPAAILADVIDEDTHRNGEERTGLFFAIWGLSSKVSVGVAVVLAFVPLSFVGFDAKEGAENSGLALMTLGLLYAGLPVILKLIAIRMMWDFPLDEAKQRQIRAELEAGK